MNPSSKEELERQLREFDAGWFQMTGQSFYTLPPHHNLIMSGWLDVYLEIPRFQEMMLKNSFTISYRDPKK